MRACSAVGQQKHPDCSGEWTELVAVRSAIGAPHIVICDAHLRGLADSRGFLTPKVTERKPKLSRAKQRELVEELSL